MSKFIIKNLEKTFINDNKNNTLFRDINLEISTDKITVILGKSGCGKTTLLRIIAGLENISFGTIEYLSEEKNKDYKIGFVFQESRLMPWLSVEDNIKIHDTKNKILSSNIDRFLDLVSLKDCKKLFPNALSGGMSNRVAIARALAYNPDILLMDEPFSALDYFTRKNLQQTLIEIFKSTKKGIIFVTHDIDEAITIANDIIVISNGSFKTFTIKNPQPKDIDKLEFLELKKEIKELLK